MNIDLDIDEAKLIIDVNGKVIDIIETLSLDKEYSLNLVRIKAISISRTSLANV